MGSRVVGHSRSPAIAVLGVAVAGYDDANAPLCILRGRG